MANFNYNRIMLGGRLTAEPELRQTQGGTPMATFTIAVSRRFRSGQQDQGQQTADFFRCVAWRATAEFVARYFHKGSSIFVSGNVQNNNWTDQQGVKHYSVDVAIDDVQFVDSRAESQGYQSSAPSPYTQSSYSSGGQTQSQSSGYTPSSYMSPGFSDSDKEPSFEEIPEDDSLPF